MGSRIVMAGVAVLMAVASTSCEPVTDAGVRYVAIAEDGTVVATMAEYIIGSQCNLPRPVMVDVHGPTPIRPIGKRGTRACRSPEASTQFRVPA